MKYLIFSDLHANVFGLKTILSFKNNHNIDKLFFLGDIIGYNAFPKECIELFIKNNIKSIKGNHEALLLTEISLNTCGSENAQFTLKKTRELLEPHNIKYLKNLPDHLNLNERCVLIHGSFKSNYETINTINKAKDNFEILKEKKKQIAFFGHTHRPGAYIADLNLRNIQYVKMKNSLELNKECLYLINPGSAGETRHNLPLSFLIFDDIENKIEFQYFTLSHDQSKILKKRNKHIFGGSRISRLPAQLKEKAKKIYYTLSG